MDSGNPFFLKLAVSAPHDGPVDGLPRIADRYLSAFPGLKVPRVRFVQRSVLSICSPYLKLFSFSQHVVVCCGLLC